MVQFGEAGGAVFTTSDLRVRGGLRKRRIGQMSVLATDLKKRQARELLKRLVRITVTYLLISLVTQALGRKDGTIWRRNGLCGSCCGSVNPG